MTSQSDSEILKTLGGLVKQDDIFPQTTQGTVFAPDLSKSTINKQLGQLCSDVLGRVKDIITLPKLSLLTVDKQNCACSI